MGVYISSFAEAWPNQRPEQRFDPRFVTKFGTRIISFNNELIEIHRTNSLPLIVEAVISLEIGEPPQTLQDIAYHQRIARDSILQDSVLGFLAQEGEVVNAVKSILDVRAIEKKDTPLRLVDLETQWTHETTQETSENEPIRDYYFSLGYDEMAARARSMDSSYDLLNFVS